MYPIPESLVRGWKLQNAVRLPNVVGVQCPGCGQTGNFTLADVDSSRRGGAPCRAKCPACAALVHFYITGSPDEGDDPPWLWMHPAPSIHNPLVLSDVPEVTEQLQASYEEAVRALNVGLWVSAASQARRTLEGIAKLKLPASKQGLPLVGRLTALPEEVELGLPIQQVAGLLRQGGNVAAHFDLDRPPPDENIARGLVELLEAMMEYLYLLPRNVEEVRARLEGNDHEQT